MNDQLQKPEHLPWCGPNYTTATTRLLLLGKSHYDVKPSDDSPEFTRQLIRCIRDGEAKEPFFTKAAALVGAATDPPFQPTSDFWDRIAFSNYVPVTVGDGVHDAPTPAMWQRARVRLLELLETLAPTHVLSLGKEQWNAIALPGWTSTPVRQTSAGTIRVWRSGTRAVIATPINHPTASFGFSEHEWVDHVRIFLGIDPAADVGIPEP
jgi:hypothetical protein